MSQLRYSRHALGATVASVCSLAIAGVASAAIVDVTNPSFEAIGGTVYNEFTFGPPPGWGLYDPGSITSGGDGPTFFIGTLDPTASGASPGSYPWFPDGATDGERVAISFNYTGSGGTGTYGLTQTLDHTLQSNTTYTLQVDVGNIASGIAIDNTPYNLDGFPGYRIDLLAGGVLLAQDNNTLAGLIPEGQFATSTVAFTTGASHPQLGQNLTIRLVNLNIVDPSAPAADLEVDFDNVRLDATIIPEPAALAIVLFVAAAHLRRIRD